MYTLLQQRIWCVEKAWRVWHYNIIMAWLNLALAHLGAHAYRSVRPVTSKNHHMARQRAYAFRAIWPYTCLVTKFFSAPYMITCALATLHCNLQYIQISVDGTRNLEEAMCRVVLQLHATFAIVYHEKKSKRRCLRPLHGTCWPDMSVRAPPNACQVRRD